MASDDSWIKKVLAARGLEAQLTALLDTDLYLIQPFSNSKIREHPFWVTLLKLVKQDESAIAKLIGYLEDFDVLGQWSLILLPDLTGENAVPESHRDKNELLLELSDWVAWAEQKKIKPIL